MLFCAAGWMIALGFVDFTAVVYILIICHLLRKPVHGRLKKVNDKMTMTGNPYLKYLKNLGYISSLCLSFLVPVALGSYYELLLHGIFVLWLKMSYNQALVNGGIFP